MAEPDMDDFEKALKDGLDRGLIKVHFTLDGENGNPGGESVWAIPIGKKYAKVANIPFFVEDVSIDDIVEIEPNDESSIKEYVGLVNKATYKCYIKYHTCAEPEDTHKKYTELCRYLDEKKCRIESAVEGYASVAFPVSIEPENAVEILGSAPNIESFEFDDEEEDDDNDDETSSLS
jgi:hypothetical protein